MKQRIIELIGQSDFLAAANLLSKEIEQNGFDDTTAILGAEINAGVGDYEGYISMVEKGLDINPTNYELYLMQGNYYTDKDILKAYNSYESAYQFCRYNASEKSEDFRYIKEFLETFRNDNISEIERIENALPILIYKSEDICFGILNRFADILADIFEAIGEIVEVVDVNEMPIEDLTKLCYRRYKAVLGIQTYVFSVFFQDGRNIHDFIFGPKYNMIFDHPACMYNHFTKGPIDYTILTHDRNYQKFIKEYYPQIKSVEILPPGGIEIEFKGKKEYDLIFLGSYKSPETWKYVIKELDDIYDNRASKLVEYMKMHPNELYENSAKEVLGKNLDTKAFYDLKQTYFNCMSYFREKIIISLLEQGIKIDVFGDSWKCDRFNNYPNLIVHSEVTFDESLRIYAKSKASLNIMSWHKDGRTERVANSMLNHSLVITDKTDYLCENYKNDEDIILFDLKNIEELGDRIKDVLSNDEKLKEMTDKAFDKVVLEDTWEVKAKEFLEINKNRKVIF